jgi:flavin-dependent dehydrogenase
MIIADGVNSRTAASLNMNQDRILFSTALCLRYTLEGVRDAEPAACKFHMGLAYQSKGPVIMVPALEKELCHLIVMGNRDDPPVRIFRRVVAAGPLAGMREGARVVERVGCGVKAFTSMPVPYRGNALAIGDAAAFIEVETQGALMCGYQAGSAAVKELAGEPGFAGYAQWWRKSFEFNTDEYLRVAQGYALVPAYTDDELDYLFALTEDQVLPGTLSQYASPKLMWDCMLRHREKIARERPELSEKIKRNRELTIKGTF